MVQPPLQIGTYTDLAISTFYDSVIYSVFDAIHCGRCRHMAPDYGGGTGFTLQLVQIINFIPETPTNPPVVTLSAVAGTLGATGGPW